MTLGRYLASELLRPFAAILAVLIALFGSYSAANFLRDAVNGLLPGDIVVAMTALKVLVALEVLVPAAFYASVILAFSRLHGESEFAAMFALRVTPATLIRTVGVLAACLAVAVGSLSLFARPFANAELHALSGAAASQLDVAAMEAGSFYIGQDGTRVIYVTRRDGPRAPGRKVFIRMRRSDGTDLISARLAYPVDTPGEAPQIELRDVHVYKIDRPAPNADEVIRADGLVLSAIGADQRSLDQSPIVTSTWRLLTGPATAADVAELQWRLSTPLSTLLLALLAVPLSRGNPRERRGGRYVTAALIYFGYYLLVTSARTWVQHGAVASVPGIWWVPALLSLGVATALFRPGLAPAR